MAVDKYKNFKELQKNEVSGVDYTIRYQKKNSNWAIITPHGGGIEPGTSELVRAIAGSDYSYYSFEGTKNKKNIDLHIISENFDEIVGDEIANLAKNIIAFHGCTNYPNKILMGGLDIKNRELLVALLKKAGFDIDNYPPPELSGSNPDNICNRGNAGEGIQLELDTTVRKSFFKGLERKNRKEKQPAFYEFVKVIRNFLEVDRYILL